MRAEIVPGEGFIGKRDEVCRRGTALAADAQHEGSGVIDQMTRTPLAPLAGDRDAQSLAARQGAEPVRLAVDGNTGAGHRRHGKILHVGRIGEDGAGGRLIERGAESKDRKRW